MEISQSEANQIIEELEDLGRIIEMPQEDAYAETRMLEASFLRDNTAPSAYKINQ